MVDLIMVAKMFEMWFADYLQQASGIVNLCLWC